MTQMPTKQSEGDMKKEALKLCKEFLGGPWTDITLSQLLFSPLSGGLSNTMYRCSLPENIVIKNSRTPKYVVLRIYGPVQEDPNVIVTEAATFMLLAERNLGPKLYGVFPNGRLEEFIPSRIVKKKDYRLVYKKIAKELAKIHALNVPVRKVPDFWLENITKWLEEAEIETLRQTNKSFEFKEMYKEEMEWLLEEMKKTNSPVVYCHNDLQGGNILIKEDSPNPDEPEVILIDFEFGAYNYRTFDLANQFCEWCFDYNTEEFPFFTVDLKKFPSTEEQTAYIRAYLEQLVELHVLRASCIEEELQNILSHVTLFAMACHLLWSLWSEKMRFVHTGFAHIEHGNVRRNAYWMLKEKLLQSSYCNGISEKSSNSNS